ncbi:MAG: glycosyltransferase family 4 protein [Candidatus Marinimicrobia bacterium]|nr:glycosyltransferase family 4 protein [Candidatus Neomarinimicrobiota bacterium]
MDILFFVPAIHQLPTGGNIYNQKIIEHLSKIANIKVVIAESELLPIQITTDFSNRNNGVIIIDSLLANDIEGIREIRNEARFVRLILVVHYLHLLNPKNNDLFKVSSELEMLRLFNGFIAISHYSRHVLISHNVSPEDIAVVHPGVDEVYHSSVPQRTGLNVIRLLTVSNMLPGKGLIEFVDVLEKIKSLSWTWDLVGSSKLDSDYSSQFKNRLSNSLVKHRVQIHENLVGINVLHMYNESDIFIHPAKFDNAPLVIREAMIRGLPIVAYQVGGIREILDSPSEEWLIPPGDTDGMAKAITELINDEQRRDYIGKAGLERSKSFLTWNQVGEKFHSFLKSAYCGMN